jgi:hypothetical protein
VQKSEIDTHGATLAAIRQAMAQGAVQIYLRRETARESRKAAPLELRFGARWWTQRDPLHEGLHRLQCRANRWPVRAVLRKTRVPTTPVERISDDDSSLLEADVHWSVGASYGVWKIHTLVWNLQALNQPSSALFC